MLKEKVLLIGILGLAASGISLAQNTAGKAKSTKDTLKLYNLPSVSVTTSRAEQRKTPVPFTEITSSDISKRSSIEDLPHVLAETPSMLVFSDNGTGLGYSNITMRGFGQRRIAVSINGIPQNDPEDHNAYWIDFPDLGANIGNIQVQRGAGVSHYGAAAIGGSINMTTTNFLDKKGITLETGIGFQEYGATNEIKQNANKFSFSASSGLVDNKYGFYGRLSRIVSDGYREHSWSVLNSYFLSAVRFDENVTTQINVFGGPLSDGLVYNGLPKGYMSDKAQRRLNYNYWSYDSTNKTLSWTTTRRQQEVEEFSQPHYELLNDWKISDNLLFKSSLFYYTGEGYFDYDGTGWASADMFRWNKENGYDKAPEPGDITIIRAFVGNRHGGWIPRIVYSHDNGTLIAGAEFRKHSSEHWGKVERAQNYPTNYDPDFKFYSYTGKRDIFSLFAREEYSMTNDITVSAEMQLVNHNYKIADEKEGNFYKTYTNIDGKQVGGKDDLFSVNYLFLNPRLGVNYNVNEQSSIYWIMALTSREPRMNNLYDASSNTSGAVPLFEYDTTGGVTKYDFSKPLIKPERMFNLEFGYSYKSDRISANANAYLMEFSDELVKSGHLDKFGNPIDGNAPKTRHFGLELQTLAQLYKTANLSVNVSANATLSKNYIVEYKYKTKAGKEVNLADNTVAGFPDLMGSLRLSVENNNFYVSIAGKFVGDFRTDNYGDLLTASEALKEELGSGYYNDNKVDAYALFNLDASYTLPGILSFERVVIKGHVGNLFNNLCAVSGEGKEFFPIAERNYYFGIEFGL